MLDLKRVQTLHLFQLYELKFCSVGVAASVEQEDQKSQCQADFSVHEKYPKEIHLPF